MILKMVMSACQGVALNSLGRGVMWLTEANRTRIPATTCSPPGAHHHQIVTIRFPLHNTTGLVWDVNLMPEAQDVQTTLVAFLSLEDSITALCTIF